MWTLGGPQYCEKLLHSIQTKIRQHECSPCTWGSDPWLGRGFHNRRMVELVLTLSSSRWSGRVLPRDFISLPSLKKISDTENRWKAGSGVVCSVTWLTSTLRFCIQLAWLCLASLYVRLIWMSFKHRLEFVFKTRVTSDNSETVQKCQRPMLPLTMSTASS